ncbi:hypothetical protein BB539_10060 [Escherichia coli]|nr:hypothetical protein [Escherichia coli]HCC75860.1 hypothetical protein [Shigella sp.]EEW1720903.1 hypothetical protein [Escherichia coli]EEY4013878.1 hypothetical protein [Escherichia coli]EFN7465586.1 hypothetical protein [Escherichia coli]
MPYAGEVFPSVIVLAPTRKIWCRLSGCQNVFLNNCRWVSVVDGMNITKGNFMRKVFYNKS